MMMVMVTNDDVSDDAGDDRDMQSALLPGPLVVVGAACINFGN